jgi:hypothetical protein
MTKLPRAAIATSAFSRGSSTQLYYTEAQMLQFRRDVLDEAARVCDNAAKPEPSCGQTDEEFACSWCADAIRNLKDET